MSAGPSAWVRRWAPGPCQALSPARSPERGPSRPRPAQVGAGSPALAPAGGPHPDPGPFPPGTQGGSWKLRALADGPLEGTLCVLGLLAQRPLSSLLAGGFLGSGRRWGGGGTWRALPRVRRRRRPRLQTPRHTFGKDGGPPETGKDGARRPASSCGPSPAGLSCPQTPLLGSGGPGPSAPRGAPTVPLGGGGAGSAPSPPPHSQPRPLKNNEVQVALREPGPRWLQGPPPARAQLTTTRGWEVKPLSCQVVRRPSSQQVGSGLGPRPANGSAAAACLGPTGHTAPSPACLPGTGRTHVLHGTFRRPVGEHLQQPPRDTRLPPARGPQGEGQELPPGRAKPQGGGRQRHSG